MLRGIAIGVIFLLVTAFSTDSRIGKTVSDFKLISTGGSVVSLSNYPAAKGFIVVFTCNHCPFAKLYYERLNALHTEFSKQGVPLLAISSTDTVMYQSDSYDNMKALAKQKGFKYPYLFDGTQTVAKNFRADKTPHAFVIWKVNGTWQIKYNGAIDDNGNEPTEVKTRYLANAVNELLAGKPVTVQETKSIGCSIHYR
jgi:peroxiredoxin